MAATVTLSRLSSAFPVRRVSSNLGRTGEYVPVRSGGRQKRECFEYTGEKLCWEGISKLKDGRGITVAKLNTPFFRWTNIGELSIAKMTEDKREVVISTLAAMHWRMQLAAAKAAEERHYVVSLCDHMVLQGDLRLLA